MHFEYQTVDVPEIRGRLDIDSTVSHMAQEGWRPLVLIPPWENYRHNSIVFEREVTRFE